MAENKKSFVLYADQIHALEYLTNEERGKVIFWLFEYVNDRNPAPLEGALRGIAELFRQQLKRDLVKWNQKQDRKSNSGKIGNLKRWHPDLFEDYQKGCYSLDRCLEIANGRKVSQPDPTRSDPIAKIAVTDNVNVNANANVNVNAKKEIDYSNEVVECYKTIVKFFPFHLQPTTVTIKKNWFDTIEKLNRIDSVPFELIIDVVKRARKDPFWSKTFLSITKLRKANPEGIKYIIVLNEQTKNETNKQGNFGTEERQSANREAVDRVARQYEERKGGA